MSTNDGEPENQWASLPGEPASAGEAPPARSRFGPVAARTVAPALAALLVGGGGVFVLDHRSGAFANADGTSAAAFGFPDGNRDGGGFGGGVSGEERVQGTVTATGASSITIRSSTGATATYSVNATSQIVRNGSSATLADVRVGDTIFVHLVPSSSGGYVVERLFAGTSATGGDGGFGPPPSSGGTTGGTAPGVSIQ